MAIQTSIDLRDHMLDGGSFKAAMDGGFMYFFAGPVPASVEDALTGSHTLIAELTESNDGNTGLTFDAAAGGFMPKNPGETWSATAQDTGNLSFFRFCETGDDPTTAGANNKRIQGTIGSTAGYDIQRSNTSVTVSDPIVLDLFTVYL